MRYEESNFYDIVFAFMVLTLQSCYTLIARRSFNVRRWIREHEYQYIDNRAVRDWNQYYWRPSSQFKKRLRGGEETVKEEEEFETPEKGRIVKEEGQRKVIAVASSRTSSI